MYDPTVVMSNTIVIEPPLTVEYIQDNIIKDYDTSYIYFAKTGVWSIYDGWQGLHMEKFDKETGKRITDYHRMSPEDVIYEIELHDKK